MIGGALARPCISYPNLFPRGTIWDRYPYLLPNLFSAAAVFCGVVIGLLFLEETHSEKKHRRDRGVELGKFLTSWVRPRNDQPALRKAEKQALLDDDELPGYRTTENSPRLTTTSGDEPRESLDLNFSSCDGVETAPVPKSKVFTKPVILNIISYGILAL